MALQHLGAHLRDDGDGMQALRLFRRAWQLHGDKTVFDLQVSATLHVALNQISTLLDPGRFDEAGEQLEWLARFAPVEGHLARLLGTVWLIQGREAEAAAMPARMAPDIPAGDSGLSVALAALDGHRQRYDVIGTVVIPAYNAADTIGESLDSVLASLAHYRRATGKGTARIHIVVVDDASTDDTLPVVRGWGRAHPDQDMALIAQNRNGGVGRARNAGAAAARGPYLWFLDSDDLFLEPHLHCTASLLDRDPTVDYVRTETLFDGIDDQISPVWRKASRQTYPCNLCIRRTAHDRSGGFPEEDPFCPARAEDVAYSRALMQMFKGVAIQEKTVFYRMRPGNVLDHLQQEMTSGRSPGEGAVVDARFMAIEILIRRRLYALKAEQAEMAATQADLAKTLMAQAHADTGKGEYMAALEKLRRAAATAPTLPAVWFEAGMAAYRLAKRAEAQDAFTRAIALQPDLYAARVNLGLLLLEEGTAADALPHLRHAVGLNPTANALFLLARTERKLGLRAEAAAHLDRALTLSPGQAEYHAERSGLLLDGGDATASLAAAQAAASLSPRLYDAHAAMAAALEALDRRPEALAAWDRAIACNQGYGEAFTRRALLLLDAQHGPPPAPHPRAATDEKRLAVTRLGSNGRFGNQLLQYGVARLYAQRHGLTLETPPWLGRHLFDLDDPLPGPALPRLSEEQAALTADMGPDAPPRAAGHDIDGYFCSDMTALAPFAEDFRGFFTQGRLWTDRMQQIRERLRANGNTLVALHLRRGDFGWGPFWTAPEAWYLRWLEGLWPTLTRPLLYVATDDPACVRAFRHYSPLTATDLGVSALAGAGFLDDFQALCEADIMAISNSTFSFTASLVNRRATAFLRPDRAWGGLALYHPWMSPVLLG
ncbi:glycosyltransferase [Niveispirillum sp. KHB5.9]|uniref:glycosyltransferase n=1 Tax=Niveispirillum sp. KHB5.9 TaxID=3400269 RepID=UPI003A865D86